MLLASFPDFSQNQQPPKKGFKDNGQPLLRIDNNSYNTSKKILAITGKQITFLKSCTI